MRHIRGVGAVYLRFAHRRSSTAFRYLQQDVVRALWLLLCPERHLGVWVVIEE